MFSFIRRAMRHDKIRRQVAKEGPTCLEDKEIKIAPVLAKNIAALKDMFGDSGDFILRPFHIRGEKPAVLFFVDGLAKSEAIHNAVLKPLMIESRLMGELSPGAFHSMEQIMETFTLAGETKVSDSLIKGAEAALSGDCVLLVEGIKKALIISVKGWEKRSISEPQTDTVIRGPREGFTESLRTNTALIRRRLKVPELRMEHKMLGMRSRTQVCLAYIENLANPALLEEVRRRLQTIDTDAIINSGYIEEFIEDKPLSLFPTVNYTEKPDVVVAKLLEGRVAIITDGTPFVLTAPLLFIENFQTAEDYAVRPVIALSLRLVRLFSFFISIMMPAMYVALTTYHQELIPTPLLFTMSTSSEGLPFPAAIETAIMLAAFEIIKEAGIRLPKPVGQAISIVGALVMGQAATQAGIVGAPVVIIIALTAVTGFVSPSFSDVSAILRWYLLIFAATFGGLGIAIAMMMLLVRLASIKSFSTDYLAPLAPFQPVDAYQDTLYRAPHWQMRTRPISLKPMDIIRQKMKRPDFIDTKPHDIKKGERK